MKRKEIKNENKKKKKYPKLINGELTNEQNIKQNNNNK